MCFVSSSLYMYSQRGRARLGGNTAGGHTVSVLWVESQSYEGLGVISVVELAVEVVAILGSGVQSFKGSDHFCDKWSRCVYLSRLV